MKKPKLPERGTPRETLLEELRAAHRDDAEWAAGRTWSMIYNAGPEVMGVAREAYLEYMVENALGPTTYPSLRRFETEVVAMAADLLGGDDQTVGTMTSGGTESILMAVKTARDYARAAGGLPVGAGSIVMPASAHPAFDKAAHYFGLESRRIPVGGDLRADVEGIARAVDDETVLVVGSAPSYPHGVVDPIERLAAIAAERGVWFHTDACLGGFLLPHLRDLGHPIPPFDLAVPGVTSISADVHKYGYAAKGASVVLYRDDERRKHQFFVAADWSGGIYATPAIAGARTGGSIAAAWAVLRYLGRAGYRELARGMMETTDRLKRAIADIDGLEVLGEPDMTVLAFGSETVNVFALADALQARRWHVERQHLPPSIHLMVCPRHADVVDEFIEDLRAATDEVRDVDPSTMSGMAAMYGMMGAMPDRGAVRELVLQFLTQLYS